MGDEYKDFYPHAIWGLCFIVCFRRFSRSGRTSYTTQHANEGNRCLVTTNRDRVAFRHEAFLRDYGPNDVDAIVLPKGLPKEDFATKFFQLYYGDHGSLRSVAALQDGRVRLPIDVGMALFVMPIRRHGRKAVPRVVAVGSHVTI